MATVTFEVTQKELNRWRMAAGGTADLGTYLAKAGNFYAERLAARLELARRMEREGRL
jgi:hypothetical protein